MLLKDIRDYQILFLSFFLFLGIGTRDWTLRSQLIGVLFITCLSTQWLLSLVISHWSLVPKDTGLMINVRSPLITSLGLSLLLRADDWTTMALAGFCAIASKFFFKIGDKHLFNPANFGIISALALTPDAWVSPGQWGDDWWYALLFTGTGGMVSQASRSLGYYSRFFGFLCVAGSDSQCLAGLDLGCLLSSFDERVFIIICPIYGD